MTDNQTQTDVLEGGGGELASPPPPKVRKPRPKKYDTTREYNRRYYHDVVKKQEPQVCLYCAVEVVCRSSLLRHQRRSKHCQWLRASTELAELKANTEATHKELEAL